MPWPEWLQSVDTLSASFWETIPGEVVFAGRAAAMYAAGLVIVRIGKNRLLGRTTAFDIVLAFILGSLFSRAINGTAPLAGTVTAGLTLVLLHWLIALISSRWRFFDWFVKGQQHELIRDGIVQRESMRRAEISARDLHEALRLKAGVDDAGQVRLSCLERNGEISVLPQRPAVRLIEVDVAEGVQRLRIELV